MPVWLLPAAIGGASLIGGAFGMGKAARQRRKMRRLLRKREDELNRWFNTEYYTPFMQSEQAKSVVQSLSKQIKKQNRITDNRAAVAGATPEAQVAARGEIQDRYSDAINKLGGYATQYKNNILRYYQQRKDNLLNQKGQLYRESADGWMNFAGNAFNLAAQVGLSEAMGAFGKGGNKSDGEFKHVESSLARLFQ